MNMIRGYKVFDPNWTCRGFQYEVGKTYELDGKLEICKNGFHFCKKLIDCYNYYDFNSCNKVAEIEAIGEVFTKDNKSATDKIKIVREISWHEVLDTVNTGIGNSGKGNSGNHNSGYSNSGNYNLGNYNSGNHNSGYSNSGNHNSGYSNSGNYNLGNYNSGNYNSGNYNSGNYNSGNYNSGKGNSGNYNSGKGNSGNYNSGSYNSGDFNIVDYSNGFFNTASQPVYMFNKITDLTYAEIEQLSGIRCLYNHLHHFMNAGTLKEMFAEKWGEFTEGEKQAIRELPNFDSDIFYEITGVKL